jgi:hypothetical protein
MKLESLTLLTALSAAGAASQPRAVYIKDQQFIQTSTNLPIVLTGPNVVVKGCQSSCFSSASQITRHLYLFLQFMFYITMFLHICMYN